MRRLGPKPEHFTTSKGERETMETTDLIGYGLLWLVVILPAAMWAFESPADRAARRANRPSRRVR